MNFYLFFKLDKQLFLWKKPNQQHIEWLCMSLKVNQKGLIIGFYGTKTGFKKTSPPKNQSSTISYTGGTWKVWVKMDAAKKFQEKIYYNEAPETNISEMMWIFVVSEVFHF